MNDKVTISTLQLFQMFPDADSARKYLEGRLWPKGPVCPCCKETKRLTARKAGFHRCLGCGLEFTVRTGTVFGRSHVPLHKWLYAMYLLVTSRKGISSLQLSKEIGITQKSAWFVLHRLREACGAELAKLTGVVEIDETYIGGRERNKHAKDRLHAGRGTVGKTAVLGMRERGKGGRTVAKRIDGTDAASLGREILAHVAPGSAIHTDEHTGYAGLGGLFFDHKAVNHSAGEYVGPDGETTNGVESVWAVLKRGVHGIYHHISDKHTERYVDEFAFRLNDGNVRRHTMRRLDSFVDAVAGKRITYKELVA